MKKFICKVCGYVHEGNTPPEFCPKCKAPASAFEEVKTLKGSKTEANLQAAFAGESQATNKYTYFASKAKKDGYMQIAAIFEETAKNEREHAKMWYKLLNGGEISGTEENLRMAAEGENYEWTDMYKEFAKTALTTSPACSTAWRRSKRSTKSAISPCSTTSRAASCSPATAT